jgi:hypothetical protein
MQVSDSVQMSLLFADIELPYHAPELSGMYKGFGIMTLDFMPNVGDYLESWANPAAETGSKPNATRRLLTGVAVAEDKYAERRARLFLVNIGGVLSLYLMVAILYPIIVLLSARISIFQKVRSYFEWSGFYASLLFNFYKVIHAAVVQLKHVLTIANNQCSSRIKKGFTIR